MENAFPKRKKLRLQNYDYSRDNAYFITICTQNKRHLLSKIHSLPTPFVELSDIGKIVEETLLSMKRIQNVYVDKYVIMPNHVHAIVIIKHPKSKRAEQREDGVQETVHAVQQSLSHLVGGLKRLCHQRIGKIIFQRSFYDHIIRDQYDYDARSRYILENPKNWLTDELYVFDESI